MIKLKNILKEETIVERMSITGTPAKDILFAILPMKAFAATDDTSRKELKKTIDELVKTLNNFYTKHNIDRKIIL